MQGIHLESVSQKKKTAARADLLGHLILVAPLFLFYHLGLLVSPRATNGADLITRLLGYLAGLSWLVYLVVMLGFLLVYLWVLRRLRRNRKFDVRRFPRVLLEAAVVALIMGPVASLLVREMHLLGQIPSPMGPIERLVASAGAGFYEELVFRLLGIGLLAGWLENRRLKKWLALSLAVLLTAALFSAVHYLGPGSDRFALDSFVFRAILGMVLGGIFVFRGFATAAYAHFFYDVYVMLFLMG